VRRRSRANGRGSSNKPSRFMGPCSISVREERTPGNTEGRPSGGLREVLSTRSQRAAG
jgi:hypothetical protein